MRPALFTKSPQIPETRAEIRKLFGDPRPRLNDNGNLVATNKGFRNRITRVELPVEDGNVLRWVHEDLADLILDACIEVAYYAGSPVDWIFSGAEGLTDTAPIKTIGTYCVRYIRGSKTKRLSLHSFGIAVDINARENRMGKPGKITANSLITFAFERRGFSWGGHWRGRSCDPMHFEMFWRGKGPFQGGKR
jgi:hypothetical protein